MEKGIDRVAVGGFDSFNSGSLALRTAKRLWAFVCCDPLSKGGSELAKLRLNLVFRNTLQFASSNSAIDGVKDDARV